MRRKEKRKEAKKSGLVKYRVTNDSGFSRGKGSTALSREPGTAGRGGEWEGGEARLDTGKAESSSMAEAIDVERLMARTKQGEEEIYTCVPDTLLSTREEKDTYRRHPQWQVKRH